MREWLHEVFTWWDNFIRRNEVLTEDIVVVHMACDTDMLDVLLDEAVRLHDAGMCENVHVLTADDIEIKIFGQAGNTYKLAYASLRAIQDIARLYSIYPFFDRIYFDSYSVASDYDVMTFRGVNGFSDREIACIAVYDMPELLNLVEAKPQCSEHEARFVDWERLGIREKLRGCEDSTDITVRLKQDVIKPEDDIVLFAVTITMRSVLENFKEYSIRAVIDNDSSLEGEEIEGIPIHTPEYLKSLRKSVKIIVTSRRYRQICEQLQAMGYRTGEQVFIAHASVLNEKPLSVIEETLDGRIVRGEEIYYDLRKHYGSIPVYIDPHTGTGDVYFSWLYLDKNEEFILIVPTESCRKLAEHLGIKSVLMSGEDISALAAYGRAKGLSDIGMKILNYSFDQYVTGRIRGYKGLDYNMMLQRTVFGAKERAVPIRIPQRDSDCLFAEYGIRKGHTVLLSPYAGHAEDIPMLFWRKLAEWLKREGYCVCTNISGEEKSIEGTKGLSLDYSEVIDFVDKAGVFIGLRSGLCDIIAPTSARMAVIYPNQMFTRSVDYYNYFSLEKMGLREENLLEMIWSRGDENYYMEKIASFLC